MNDYEDNKMEDNLFKLIINYRDYYGRYHNHKETMAWLATGLYLYSIYYLMQDKSLPGKYPSDLANFLIAILISIIMAISFVFIIWQFKQKEIASGIILACNNILSKLLIDNNYRPDLTERKYYLDCFWPKEIYIEIVNINKLKKYYKKMRLSEIAIYSVMIIWPLFIYIISKNIFYEKYYYILILPLIFFIASIINRFCNNLNEK
jgi:hypothetical protein